MKKPSWKSLVLQIAIFAFFYLVTDIAIHRTFYWGQVTRAVEVALVGATMTWYSARRRWEKAHIQSEGVRNDHSASPLSNA